MKKTVSINISGLMFNIDEDAYQYLAAYMDSIRKHFAATEGFEDIIADIESRIAELLQRKINDQKQVINLTDIEQVVAALGQPFEMDTEQETTQAATGSEKTRPKRLFRDTENKMLAGVAMGMSHYFGIDPVWVRLVFVVLFLTSGVGFFIYLALWIFIPEAVTTAEKLEMRGEPVNVNTIEQSIKKEYESVKETVSGYASEARDSFQRSSRQAGQAASRLNNPLMQVLRGLARFFGILIGLIFFSLGLVLILLAGTLLLGWDNAGVWADMEIPLMGGHQMFDLLLAGPLSASIAPLALGVFIAVPLIMLVYTGLRLLIGESFKITGLGSIATGLWIASVVGLFYAGTTLAADMKEEHTYEDARKDIQPSASENLYLMAQPGIEANQDEQIAFFDQRYTFHNGKLTGMPRLLFRQSDSSGMWVQTTRSARGKDRIRAKKRADEISFSVVQQDSILLIPGYFQFDKGSKLRAQQVEVIIYMPEGKRISIPENMYPLLENDIRFEAFDRSDSGQLWLMTGGTLKPITEDQHPAR